MTVSFLSILVSPKTSILDTIKIIDPSTMQMALVVDESRRLLGMVTDGDIRRGLLRGIGLDQPVERVMNPHPTTAFVGQDPDNLATLMRQLKIRALPILDSRGVLIDLALLDNILSPSASTRENWVVLMAGGRGTRLAPLTHTLPKPMIPVGGTPLLESIICNFVKQGFHRFFLSVNYKADIIRNHFGDGHRFDAEIRYIEEDKPLGTGGALSLLPEHPTQPLIVMNGDILTALPFSQLIDFHQQNGADGTMCVREHQIQVPYGVVRTSGINLRAIVEKPERRFFVNTGIYTLNPDALDLVPKDTAYGMTDLFSDLVRQSKKTVVFPIREYWMDIGQHSDLAQAQSDYAEFFED